jgi:hypothetical protein
MTDLTRLRSILSAQYARNGGLKRISHESGVNPATLSAIMDGRVIPQARTVETVLAAFDRLTQRAD